MAIQVTCPGCHARFKVSDKFAGKQGPCPKCKKTITVPNPDEEVVIHTPEHSETGARGASGELVLKPLKRQETKVSTIAIVGVALTCLVVLGVALLMRSSGNPPSWILYFGAVALAPPLVWAGYSFLRDEEDLQPYSGVNLAIRIAICSVIYALSWYGFGFFYNQFFGDAPADVTSVFFLAPPFLLLGAGVAYCCFDLDFGSGFFHYALYLLVTIGLRLVMGLPAVGPTEGVENAATALLVLRNLPPL